MEDTINRLIEYAKYIQGKLDSGKSLKEINKESFLEREQNPNVIYLAIGTRDNKSITDLYASPIKKQKGEYDCLIKPMEGKLHIVRYHFVVTNTRVYFYERHPNKTFIDLITNEKIDPRTLL